jgi:myosin-1
LAIREYEWPDLSKHQNDISSDLRDLVGSLLVDEDDRPGPDMIVSHAFFKLSFIPEQIDSSCTHTKPTWAVKPPTSETIRRGYSEGWFKTCKASGVGEYARGRFFAVAGVGGNASVVKDVEREIKANRAPTVPIAAGTVYLPFISERKDKDRVVATNLSEIAEEREASKLSQLTEISTNEAARARTMKRAQSTRRMKENVPPAENPAAVQQALKRVRSAKGRIEKAVTDGPSDGAARAQRATERAEKVEAAPTRAHRLPSDPARQAARLEKADMQPTCTTRAHHVPEASRPAAAAEKPAMDRHLTGTTRARRLPSDPSKKAGLPRERVDEMEVQRQEVNEIRRPRQRVASREKKTTAVDSITTKFGGLIITRNHPSTVPSDNLQPQDKLPEKAEVDQPKRTSDPDRRRGAVKPTVPSEPSSPSTEVPHTDPIAIWQRARDLRNNLAAALSSRTVPRTADADADRKPDLPFVSKWVDYSKRLGIGYVLNNGTVGCIFNATAAQTVTHVVVRDGYSFLSPEVAAVGGASSLNVPVGKLPVEMYSDGAVEPIRRLEVSGERRRANAILWTKFARYMCQTLALSSEGREGEEAGEGGAPVFVRYYQRLGTVGVWGFSNGCFQVRFPAHYNTNERNLMRGATVQLPGPHQDRAQRRRRALQLHVPARRGDGAHRAARRAAEPVHQAARGADWVRARAAARRRGAGGHGAREPAAAQAAVRVGVRGRVGRRRRARGGGVGEDGVEGAAFG